MTRVWCSVKRWAENGPETGQKRSFLGQVNVCSSSCANGGVMTLQILWAQINKQSQNSKTMGIRSEFLGIWRSWRYFCSPGFLSQLPRDLIHRVAFEAGVSFPTWIAPKVFNLLLGQTPHPSTLPLADTPLSPWPRGIPQPQCHTPAPNGVRHHHQHHLHHAGHVPGDPAPRGR